MRIRRFKAVHGGITTFTILLIARACTAQQTNVMGFENLARGGTGNSFPGTFIPEGEMMISPLADGFSNGFVAWKTNDSHYRGSTAIANNDNGGVTVLSRTNGAAFDFLGLDLAGFQTYHSGTATFYGYRGLDLVISESTTITAGGNFQTFRTSKFTNVTEVRWGAAWPPQFDNVVVVLDTNLPAAQPVITLKHLDFDFTDVCGLQVNRWYILEYSGNLSDWTRQITFKAYSTINYPGFATAISSTNRFYRVRVF